MTVPLLRVCHHCGYPTPGRHASSCRDADSGVVEVAKPLVPANVAQQIRDVEAQRDGLAELLKGAVEAGERLRQELDEARARLVRVDDALRSAGIEYPLGAAGVNDLAAMAIGRLEDLQAAEAERDRMRPVVEAAGAFVAAMKTATHVPVGPLTALAFAIDAYRSSIPDAEPAPGVPIDTTTEGK